MTASSAMIRDVEAAGAGQLQTVTRLRDACLIGHRLTRAYSELRKHGRAGALVSLAAYPVLWLAYLGITCIEAGSTVHSGVASLIAPNPVARPARRLWRGGLLLFVIVFAVGQLLTQPPLTVRLVAYAVGAVCVAAWLAEVWITRRIGHRAGPLKATEKHVQQLTGGPVERGGTFAAWPHPSGQFGPLLDDVLEELRHDGITLLVQARDDDLVATYLRHGAIQPNPQQPRHLAWLALSRG